MEQKKIVEFELKEEEMKALKRSAEVVKSLQQDIDKLIARKE
jgi:malate dehydrogenase